MCEEKNQVEVYSCVRKYKRKNKDKQINVKSPLIDK